MRFFHLFLSIFVFALFLLMACREPEAPATRPQCFFERQPIDYAIIVDNSGSIRGFERTIVQEALKLFADMVDSNDQISLVSFGNDSRFLGTTLIHGPKDRKSFQAIVDGAIRFDGVYSDIRAGLSCLADNRDRIYRKNGACRTAIVFSDGFLEVAQGRNKEAYEELLSTRDGKLQDILFYTLGIGGATLDRPIVGTQGITGRILMKDKLAGVAGTFTEISDIAHLSGCFIDIIKQSKNIPEVFERPVPVFCVDSAIQELKIVLPKTDVAGTRLFDPASIELIPPEAQAVTIFNRGNYPSIDWPTTYRSLEFISIVKPKAGQWQIRLKDGAKPVFQMMVKTSIALQTKIEKVYYDNEEITFSPFIFDLDRSMESAGPYRFEMKLADRSFPASRMADGTQKIIVRELRCGDYQARFYAVNDSDNRFSRVSQAYSFRVISSPFSFVMPNARQYALIPIVSRPLDFRIIPQKVTLSQCVFSYQYLRSDGRPKLIDSTPMATGNGFYSTRFVPPAGGRLIAQMRFSMTDENNIIHTIRSPLSECEVCDLRLAVCAGTIVVVLFLIRLVMCLFLTPFAFSATVKYHGERTTIPCSARKSFHTIDVAKSLEAKISLPSRVIVDLRSRRGISCSVKKPFVTVSGAQRVIVDGEEIHRKSKVQGGSVIECRFRDGEKLSLQIVEII